MVPTLATVTITTIDWGGTSLGYSETIAKMPQMAKAAFLECQ